MINSVISNEIMRELAAYSKENNIRVPNDFLSHDHKRYCFCGWYPVSSVSAESPVTQEAYYVKNSKGLEFIVVKSDDPAHVFYERQRYEITNEPAIKDFLKNKGVNMEPEQKVKYKGYGYHGGGRPRKAESEKRKCITVSFTPDELESIKDIAHTMSSETVSEYFLYLHNRFINGNL